MAANRRPVRGMRRGSSVRTRPELFRRTAIDRKRGYDSRRQDRQDRRAKKLEYAENAARRQKIEETKRISRDSKQAGEMERVTSREQEWTLGNIDQLIADSEGEYENWNWDYEDEPQDYEDGSQTGGGSVQAQEDWNWDYGEEPQTDEGVSEMPDHWNWDSEKEPGSDEAPEWEYGQSAEEQLEPFHEDEEEGFFFLNSENRKNVAAEQRPKKTPAYRDNPNEQRPSKKQGSPERRRPAESQSSPERRRPAESQGSSERRRPAESQESPERRRPAESQGSSERRRPAKGQGSPERRRPSISQGVPEKRGSVKRREGPEVQRTAKRRRPPEDQRSPKIQRQREEYRPQVVSDPVREQRISARRKSSGRIQRERKLRTRVICAAAVVLAAGLWVYFRMIPSWCVKNSLTVQAGEACPGVESFLNWNRKEAYIVEGISEDMSLDHVQDYPVVIHVYNRNLKTTLHVVDTVPPVIHTKDLSVRLGDLFKAEDFVESVTEETDWEISYKEEPDAQQGGTYVVTLQARDEGGNVSEAQAQLTVLQDTTPPVISGVQELTIMVGESVSYKRDVTVTDDTDENVSLEIDNSQVDTGIPGDYPVVYRAVDKAGNAAEVSTVLHVKSVLAEDPHGVDVPVTEESVNEAADKILASITDSSMTQMEVLRAIYDWCHSKIAYVDETPKTSWVEGAYCGLIQRKGDCYAYAMSAKCLLTRAGIENMDIERIRVGNGMHFWNLVDIGEGWHHFDTCRRADGSTFFYLTDAELMEYSDAHTAPDYPNGTHYYDRSLYPVIP